MKTILNKPNAKSEPKKSPDFPTFNSKEYPFSKKLSSYEPHSLGRAFFSKGGISKKGSLELFDQANILDEINLNDKPLFYKKSEIPVYIFTTNSFEEAKDKYDKLDVNYNEMALFFIKDKEKANVLINLGESLLKFSNLKTVKEMKGKRWLIPEKDLKELRKDFSAQKVVAFLNKNNELFNEEIENLTGFSSKKKTKVHFTIGLFFDGTGNNRYNSESNYYKSINNNKLVFKKIPATREIETNSGTKIKIDNDSSYWNPYSNVVLLHDLYKEDSMELFGSNNGQINVTFKKYVEGIGTVRGKKDDSLGTMFAEGPDGVVGKVAKGCNDVAREIKQILGNDKEIGSLTFDVFGFSRGAAAARHFCNEILNQTSMADILEKAKPDSSSRNQGNTRVAKTVAYLPKGKKYKLGLLGKALKNNGVQNEITEMLNEKPKVKVRFLGLFDTVLSQFIIKNEIGKKIDLFFPLTRIPYGVGNFIETKLDIIELRVDDLAIDTVVHLVANDEWRENFPLTKINVQAFNKNKKGFEYYLDGAHSDIGGGYAAMKQDVDILDFETKRNFVNDPTPQPTRLYKLRDFYIKRGLCSESEISVQLVESFLDVKYGEEDVQVSHYQLISKRIVKARYSVIPMHAMKKLAEICGVNFDDDTKKQTYSFEYDIPEELKNYAKEKIENIKNKFQGKEEKKMKNKLPKNKFIHFSSNYNSSKVIERKGQGITGNRGIDKVFYINAPRYTNKENSEYGRGIYNHGK